MVQAVRLKYIGYHSGNLTLGFPPDDSGQPDMGETPSTGVVIFTEIFTDPMEVTRGNGHSSGLKLQ